MPELVRKTIQGLGFPSDELSHANTKHDTAGWTRRGEDKWRLPPEQSERAEIRCWAERDFYKIKAASWGGIILNDVIN